MKKNGEEGKVVSPEKGLSPEVGQAEAFGAQAEARSSAPEVCTLPAGGATDLPAYMQAVIEGLEEKKKYAAVHMYQCTLNSYTRFAGGEGTPMPIEEVFQLIMTSE